ncbi:MAG: undecaprenyl-diphosphatase UppP [Deltaproteobacteria bacterium]
MNAVEAIILGAIQGATEFLPISSSGHLVLAEHFLGLSETPLAFDVTLHLGTLLSVLTFFWRDWLEMAQSLRPGSNRHFDRKLLLLLILGTIPAGILGLLFEDVISQVLRSPWVVVCTLSAVAFLLVAGERLASHAREMATIGWREALLIGTAQAVAIIPGVSRSGITMSTALILGFERTAAARFSFLLSSPIIAAAGLYEALGLWKGGFPGFETSFVWGFGSAAVSGYFVISFLMRYLVRHTFYPFVWYRLLLAGLVAAILVLNPLET